MRAIFFLVFLRFVDVHSADVACDHKCSGHPMSLAVFDEKFEAQRIYEDEDQRVVVGVYYKWEHRKFFPNLGILEIVREDQNSCLSIAMEYGQRPQALLQTDMCFGKQPDDVQRAIVTSWMTPHQKGYVNVVNPCEAPTEWAIPKSLPDRNRPLLQATIVADKNSTTITRYLFCADEELEGIFLRIHVQYENIDTIDLSWGTEAYNASAYPETPYANKVYISGKKTVCLSRDFC